MKIPEYINIFLSFLLLSHGLHIISRLRNDANLRWLYQGKHPKRRGPKQKYTGKVAFNQLELIRFVTDYYDYKLYEAVVYSISLK